MRSHCPTGCAPSPPLQLPCQAPMSVAASCVAPPTAFEMPSCSSCGSGSPWLACTVLAALQPKYVTACRRRRELISPPIAVLPIHRQRRNARSTVLCDGLASAAVAQLVARRSHNPKVVGSILTGRMDVPNRRMKRGTEYIGCVRIAQRAAPRRHLYSFQVKLPCRSRHRASHRRLRLRCRRVAHAGQARHGSLVPSLPPCNRNM